MCEIEHVISLSVAKHTWVFRVRPSLQAQQRICHQRDQNHAEQRVFHSRKGRRCDRTLASVKGMPARGAAMHTLPLGRMEGRADMGGAGGGGTIRGMGEEEKEKEEERN